MSLKSSNFKNFLENSELARAISHTEEAINMISRGDKKVCFAFNDTLRASKMGAINVVMISSKVFEGRDEDNVIEHLRVFKISRALCDGIKLLTFDTI